MNEHGLDDGVRAMCIFFLMYFHLRNGKSSAVKSKYLICHYATECHILPYSLYVSIVFLVLPPLHAVPRMVFLVALLLLRPVKHLKFNFTLRNLNQSLWKKEQNNNPKCIVHWFSQKLFRYKRNFSRNWKGVQSEKLLLNALGI